MLNSCKLLYKIGTPIAFLSLIVAIVGLVIGFLGHGWITLIIGCFLFGVFNLIGRIPEMIISNRLKEINPSLTSKKAYEIAVDHLRNDKDKTWTFLGKYAEDLEISQVK
jgi:hypothetical protein